MTTQQKHTATPTATNPAPKPPTGPKRKLPKTSHLTLALALVSAIASMLYVAGELLYQNAFSRAQAEKAQEVATLTSQVGKEQSRAERAEVMLKQTGEQLAAKSAELADARKDIELLRASADAAPNCVFAKKRLHLVDEDIANLTYVREYRVDDKETIAPAPEKVEKLAALRKEQEFLLKQVSTCR
ncbi:hypothetical protein [Herbaspirillum camelliae]|uniref:hypothetical protein n=1 Tax=Herbaspirillum camelliae TaxID=1892903 RepID=UPI00094A138C|nr:hypothetical protein [Herbaspirillum camelliae]